MALFVLNRNYTLRSLSGHTVAFAKGKQTFVPPAVIKEAVAIGAERVDSKQEPLVADEKDVPKAPDQEEMDKLILDAIDQMFHRGVRGDFSGSGSPNARVISSMLGFDVDGRTRDRLWELYQTRKAEGS